MLIHSSLLLKGSKCTPCYPALNSSKSLLDELHLSINLHAGEVAWGLFKEKCHDAVVKSISFVYVTRCIFRGFSHEQAEAVADISGWFTGSVLQEKLVNPHLKTKTLRTHEQHIHLIAYLHGHCAILSRF